MKDFKYIVISDLHLGHPKTHASHIIKNLDRFFNNYQTEPEYQCIFIAGDVFDNLLDLSELIVLDILSWFRRLFKYCAKYDISIRFLEGTPSHDWKQSKLCVDFNKIDIPVDAMYIDTLMIEYIEEYNVHVLYIPDEWSESPIKTHEQVLKLLEHTHINKVDIIIMHGAFTYQLPIKSSNTHDIDKYLAITNHYIHPGHIHIHSVNDRVIAQGSFDRLAHNEELIKGGILVTITNNTHDYRFIENPHAKVYNTYTVTAGDTGKAIRILETYLSNVPTDSHIRVRADFDKVSYEELVKHFFQYNLSKMPIKELRGSMNTPQVVHQSITINKENIKGLLLPVVEKKYSLSTEKIRKVSNLLDSVI